MLLSRETFARSLDAAVTWANLPTGAPPAGAAARAAFARGAGFIVVLEQEPPELRRAWRKFLSAVAEHRERDWKQLSRQCVKWYAQQRVSFSALTFDDERQPRLNQFEASSVPAMLGLLGGQLIVPEPEFEVHRCRQCAEFFAVQVQGGSRRGPKRHTACPQCFDAYHAGAVKRSKAKKKR